MSSLFVCIQKMLSFKSTMFLGRFLDFLFIFYQLWFNIGCKWFVLSPQIKLGPRFAQALARVDSCCIIEIKPMKRQVYNLKEILNWLFS